MERECGVRQNKNYMFNQKNRLKKYLYERFVLVQKLKAYKRILKNEEYYES